jgi:sigma-E factor negative regulatory protein RseB
VNRASALWLLVAGVSTSALAQSSADALRWMQRATEVSRVLNYSGTFIYQSDSHTETSRLTHVMDGGRELERLEVLDGSPREVTRDNNEVKCYLADSHTLVLERRNTRRSFPALLPDGPGGLTDVYVIRSGVPERVAGFETQSILADPRDEFRYGRQFWVDAKSGLLLKASLRTERADAMESFTFTELRIGGPINREALKARAALLGGEWTVHDLRSTESAGDDGAWVFRNQLPGFRRVSEMKRPSRPDAPESRHIVFSDGLAAISVFIEPMMVGKPRPETGMFAMGAINIYKKMMGDVLLVVMGDVPPVALKRLGDGIEAGRR